MDLISILRVTVKRWIVVVPILIVCAAALAYLYTNQSSNYTLTGRYMLLGTAIDGPVAAQTDPVVAAEALHNLLASPSIADTLESEGLSSDVSVSMGESGAILRVSIDGESRRQVVESAQRITEMARELATTFDVESGPTIAVRQVRDIGAEDVTEVDEHFRIVSLLVVSVSTPSSGNPFPPDGLTASVLSAVGSSIEFAVDVAQVSAPAGFTVSSDGRTPIITVSVQAASPTAVRQGYDTVRDALDEELKSLQDQVGVDRFYRTIMTPLVEPEVVAVSPLSIVRPAAGIVIVGVGAAIGLAVVVESISIGRQRLHRSAEDEPVADDEDPGDVDRKMTSS